MAWVIFQNSTIYQIINANSKQICFLEERAERAAAAIKEKEAVLYSAI
jgi:hypothetical protein